MMNHDNHDVEDKLPSNVKKYMFEIRTRLRRDYAILNKNKAKRMTQAKAYYDRRNKKISYELGELVLVNHPEIKKGLARSLAPRYYGPFEIVGKYQNGCDYLIRQYGHPKARVKQIHQNRLIAYHKRGHPNDKPIESHEPTQEPDVRRKYTKNPNCTRWSKEKKLSKVESDVDSSDREQSETEETQSFEQDEPNESPTKINLKEKPSYKHKAKDKQSKTKKKIKTAKQIQCDQIQAQPHNKRIRKPLERYDMNLYQN
jgi:hypothetical protein